MTIEQFNKRWDKYLEKGHYGLAIDHEGIIDYLDELFEQLSKVEGFSYSQIKLKFGYPRVYMEPDTINTYEIEQDIQKLL